MIMPAKPLDLPRCDSVKISIFNFSIPSLLNMLSLYSFFLLVLSLSSSVLAQQACNGHTEYCDKVYPDVSQIGAHDSAFVGLLPQQNQEFSVTDQLDAGIRFLQGQTHLDIFGTFSLCHTSCFLEDAGPVTSYLSTIKSWLDRNPNEVLTLLLTNGDNVDPSMFDSAFQVTGLQSYTYAPTTDGTTLPISAWPTLASMISAGTRLVFFLGKYLVLLRFSVYWFLYEPSDSGANPTTYPYILDEFSYFFETPYDTLDPNFAECTLDRPPNGDPKGRMYIINHFLDLAVGSITIPYMAKLDETNAPTGVGSIGDQVSLCEGIYAQRPKAVLVDFMNFGDVFAAERSMNSV